MCILITGATGQLGYDVAKYCEENNIKYLAPTRSEMDITSEKSVREYCRDKELSGIIHCAAYTAVDKAEDEPELCRLVNVTGTKYITQICIDMDIPILYISTDYVFNGKNVEAWDENDITDPINTYGQSKLDGEYEAKKHKKHFILRISWVFGINGNNFVKTMLKLSKIKEEIYVVSDQIGSPTYTKDLAPKLYDIITSGKYGTYHAHNEGFCSWYEFAKEIFIQAQIKTIVHPISSKEFYTRASRPNNSKMSNLKFNREYGTLKNWKEALNLYICELKNENNKND